MFNYLIVRSNSIHCSRERAQVVRVLRHAGHLVPFYRATLCVSAVFAVARCPSVRPSVTLVYCIQTDEDIVKLLSRPSSPIILVFLTRAPVPNSKGNPFSMGAKYTGWENFVNFD